MMPMAGVSSIHGSGESYFARRSMICKGDTFADSPPNEQPAAADSGARALVYRCRPQMPKFFIKTYGCQMNERDSEQVARSLLARGYEAAPRAKQEADVVLLNTCSVRDMADQKAIGKMGMLGQIAQAAAGSRFRFSRLHGAGARGGASPRGAARRSGRRHAEISSRRRLRG